MIKANKLMYKSWIFYQKGCLITSLNKLASLLVKLFVTIKFISLRFLVEKLLNLGCGLTTEFEEDEENSVQSKLIPMFHSKISTPFLITNLATSSPATNAIGFSKSVLNWSICCTNLSVFSAVVSNIPAEA